MITNEGQAAIRDRQPLGLARDEVALAWVFGTVVSFSIGVLLLYVYGAELSNDAAQYEGLWYRLQGNGFLDAILAEKAEIGSIFLYWSFSRFLSAGATFFAIGLTAMAIKFVLIRKYLRHSMLAWWTYVAIFLYLHDATQVRAALAACVILYALLVSKGGKAYLGLALLAGIFHFSGLLILVLYFVRRPLIGLATIATLGLAWDFIVLHSSSTIAFAITYLSDASGGVSMTNSNFLLQVVVVAMCAMNWKRLTPEQRKGAYLIMAGAVLYVTFRNNAIMAHRLRELSMLGIFPLLFLGKRKLTDSMLVMYSSVAYIAAHNVWLVLQKYSRLHSLGL